LSVPRLPWSLAESDAGLLPIIRRMEDVGLLADLAHFRDLSVYLGDLRSDLDTEIHAMGGPENPGSSDQVADWIYRQLHARAKKRTQTGRGSTQDKYLEAISKDPKTRPEVKGAIDKILKRREIDTLKTRYADPMLELLGTDGRLHARILYTRTDTGRLAAKDPNVLAFPKHSDLGLLVRHGFVPADGHCLAEWDLDQVEMKVMAFDSGDELMIAEINSGVDKHKATAANVIYKKPIDDITKHERFTAKAVNFGILMGITGNGLAGQLLKNGMQTTVEACDAFIDEWMKGYPGCAQYIEGKHLEAKRYGYVTNWRGRRRWLPAANSPNEQIQAEALRQAQATPIQSGAADIFRLWMGSVWQRIEKMRAAGIWVELLLPTHDALLFEFETWAYDILDMEIKEALAEYQMFAVPITCSGSSQGQTWGEV
jgi:DNA polymerase-1